jgi:hypothetical protein
METTVVEVPKSISTKVVFRICALDRPSCRMAGYMLLIVRLVSMEPEVLYH